jgi:protein required for attachment to host cells
MSNHWYVVANQTEAKIFSSVSKDFRGQGNKNSLELIKVLENPAGQEKSRDFFRKQPGFGMRSLGNRGGVARYAEGKRSDPHEEVAKEFAKKISKYLEKCRQHADFDYLSIVAEPHFLGKLRSELSAATERKVSDWIKKDLHKASNARLEKHLLIPKNESVSA